MRDLIPESLRSTEIFWVGEMSSRSFNMRPLRVAGRSVVAVKKLAPHIVRFRLPELGEKDFRGILARCRRAAAQCSITCRGEDTLCK